MRPIEIISEIGINHNGDMKLASEMIKISKACNADVAKFQIYDPCEILDKNHPGIKPWWDVLKKCGLSKDNVRYLKDECDRYEIEFLASVFSLEAVDWAEEVGMKRYKIASRSIYEDELVRKVLDTGKETIVSLGMMDARGVPNTIQKAWASWQVKCLYCVSKYPTPLKDLRFSNRMFEPHTYRLSEIGAGIVYEGFSDHTIGTTAAAVAMSYGAKIIEKHFTLDKNMHGSDHVCSMTPDELTNICRFRDDMEEMYEY